MHHEHEKESTRSRARLSVLRVLIDRLRRRAAPPAQRESTEVDARLDGSHSVWGPHERWAEIARGLHHPDEPVILDEEGSREVIDEIIHGSPLTPERRATFERMRLMAVVHRRNEELEHTLPAER